MADGRIAISSKATRIRESIYSDAVLDWVRADSCILNLGRGNDPAQGYGLMDKVVDARKLRGLRRRMGNALREVKTWWSVALAVVTRWRNKAPSQAKTDINGHP